MLLKSLNSYCLLSITTSPMVMMTVVLLLVSDLSFAQDQNEANKKIALAKMPRQKNVDFDTPKANEFEACTIEPATELYSGRGFIVKNPAGQIVRLYIKENRGAVHWTFFKNGNEVYREIDSNADQRVDQYRWLGEGGSRWGMDNNQDGNIDLWKSISAEEVAAEAVEAIKSQDRARFVRLCLTNEDLATLRLGRKMETKVASSVTKMLSEVTRFFKDSALQADCEFVDFSGTRPSVVPAGKMGLTTDLTIYDNVSALYSQNGDVKTLSLGTLIKVEDRWRIAELPELTGTDKTVRNGRMFAIRSEDVVETPLNKELQSLIAQYNQVNNALKSERNADKKARLFGQRTELILKVAAASETEEDKKLWTRMCATEASIGYQMDQYPDGLKVLERLVKSDIAEDDKAFVNWELVQAKARDTRKGGSAQMREANRIYMEMLEQHVDTYPKSESTPQAILQLAMFEEFGNSGDSEENAIRWYSLAANNFPDTREGRFSAGAKRRLSSFGEPLSVSGTTLTNEKLNTAAFRGSKNVVIHYWSTQDQLSLDDFKRLVALQAKYRDLAIVGVNLDENATLAKNFLRQKQPNARWPHLWAEGGKLNSPLALQLGVTTVPLTILIDKQGNVAENQAITDELDRQLQRLRNRNRGRE